MVILKRFGMAIFVAVMAFIVAAPGWSDPGADAVRAKVRTAISKLDFYGECVSTSFRFGRRSEVTYQIWGKGGWLVRKTMSPSWQMGEVIIETERNYTYYVPSQNAGLKTEKEKTIQEIRLHDWKNYIDNFSRVENGNVLGKEALVLTGEHRGSTFKLMVAKDNYFPLALEISRDNLLVRSLRFTRVEFRLAGFTTSGMIPGKIKWYNDETKFWQDISIPRIQPAVSFSILKPAYLPPGFSFRRASIEELSSATVAHLIFSGPDRNMIVLFEREKLSENQRLNLDPYKDMGEKIGRTVNIHQWFEKQVHLAIMGTVSMDELKRVANSIK